MSQSERRQRVIMTRRPEGQPRESDFAVREDALPACEPDSVVVRNTAISVDPSMRIRMAGAYGDYMAPIEVGAVPTGFVTGVVEESRSDRFAEGDRVLHLGGWETHSVLEVGPDAWRGVRRLPRLGGLPDRWHLGVLGSGGVTAYNGLRSVGGLRPDDEVFVSSAAGGVGSLVVQLAKAWGHRVVGCAGSSSKVRAVRDVLGADAAFSYRVDDVRAALAEAAPDGIDLYFDNVGGVLLEAALDEMRAGGRVVLCGQVSTYNDPRGMPGPSNLFHVISKGLHLSGFLARTFADTAEHVAAEVADLIHDGGLVPAETVFAGIDQVPSAFADMLAGRTWGKTVVVLDDSVPASVPIGD